MDSESSLSVFAFLLALLLFMVVSVVEGATQAARPERVRELAGRGVAGARDLESLLNQRLTFILTLALFRIGAVITVSLSVAALVLNLTSSNWAYVPLPALAALALLLFVHGLLRLWGQRHGEWLTLRLAPVVKLSAGALAPLAAVAHWASPPADDGEKPTPGAMSSAEAFDSGEYLPLQQEADSHEARMIRAILRLEQTTAREIMVPRLDILAAPVDTPLKRLVELMLEGGHSRIPLYEDTIDSVVGILHARDLLRLLGQSQEVYDLQEIARPPLFVPDSKPLDQLLREFQEKRSHLAIVVDEYGGTAGVVSIEDLLEEIVGDISDEFDVGEPEVEMVDAQEAVMDARVSLDQVNELFATRLEGEGFDTLGGLVYSQLGKIPSPGDEVESDGLRIQVISTLGRRIKKVRVVRSPFPLVPEASS